MTRTSYDGTRGRVVGWVWHDEDEAAGTADRQERVLTKQPITVLVNFDDAKWRLPGLDEGVYPVRPVKRDWLLDKCRKPPVLNVTRQQLPLAPGFAITAHASQGDTLEAAIVDVQVPNTSSWISLYVALSRVRRADDLLIFRAFDGAAMQQGDPIGAEYSFEEAARRLHRQGRVEQDIDATENVFDVR